MIPYQPWYAALIMLLSAQIEIQWSREIEPGSDGYVDHFLPIVADAEAGFGGVLNAFELMKNMIVNGACRCSL